MVARARTGKGDNLKGDAPGKPHAAPAHRPSTAPFGHPGHPLLRVALVTHSSVSFGTQTFSNPQPGPTKVHCSFPARATGDITDTMCLGPGNIAKLLRWSHVNLLISNHTVPTKVVIS